MEEVRLNNYNYHLITILSSNRDFRLGKAIGWPKVDADAGVGAAKDNSNELDQDDEDSEGDDEEAQAKKKAKKEKIGFRDRKVKLFLN